MSNFMNPLEQLLDVPETPNVPTFKWAKVISVSGTNVTVRIDGDTSNIVMDRPDTLAALAAGNRILILRHGKRVVIMGLSGGPVIPDPEPPEPVEPPLPLPLHRELIRTISDSISNTAFAEFPITAGGRPAITTTKKLLCAVTYKCWLGISSTGMRIGIELRGATASEAFVPTWGDVIRALSSGSYMVTKYVELNPGTTSFLVMGYRENTTHIPTTSYQLLQVTPLNYIEG